MRIDSFCFYKQTTYSIPVHTKTTKEDPFRSFRPGCALSETDQHRGAYAVPIP